MSKYTKLLEKLYSDKKTSPKFKERSLQALNWYRNKIKTFFSGSEFDIEKNIEKDIRKTRNQNQLAVGNFYIFGYEPINKIKLPYYDFYPLTLLIEKVPGGFIGLNMHYLDPYTRAIFMDNLYKMVKPDQENLSLKINITYDLLKNSKRLKYYKPCIKKYKTSRIKKFLIKIHPEEWDIFLFLPFEGFVHKDKDSVWEISNTIIEKE